MSLRHLCWPLLTLLSLGGFAANAVRAQAPPSFAGEFGAVFAVYPAGDMRGIEVNLRAALTKAHFPLRVVPVSWSQTGAFLSDQRDKATHQAAGWQLACRIWHYRQTNPGGKVYLVGYSAGSAVALAATQHLPANTIDRIVLLAPSVACDHDIRPALCASRQGIDLFFSHHDDVLDFTGSVVGATDGRRVRCAGEVGFTPVITCPADAQLYRKLYQHRWRPEYAELGYNGGHFSVVRRNFLYHVVLPLLMMP